MKRGEDLVSVYRAANFTEAHLVKNLLEEADIDAQVTEESSFAYVGLTAFAPRVLVRLKDQTRAQAVIAEYEEKLIARAELPDWTCSNCGLSVPGAYDECDNCETSRPAIP